MGKWLWLAWSAILSILVLASWVILGIGVNEPLFLTIAELTIVAMCATLVVAGWTILHAMASGLESGGWLDAILHHEVDYRSWIAWPSGPDRWRLCATGLGAVCVQMSVLILGTAAAGMLVRQACLASMLFIAASLIAAGFLVAALGLGLVLGWRWLALQRQNLDGPKEAD